MKTVVVVGAGERVLGAVLPALGCLRSRFHVRDVVARTRKTISFGERAITTTTLDDVDLDGLDLIVVAVSLPEIPRVVHALAKRTSKAVLMLDTPVLPPSGLWASRRFSAFRRVVVSEDNLALPPFLLARSLIETGQIGALQRIYFFHNGFKGHALASLKMLASSPIDRIVDRKFAGKRRQKTISMANGVTAVMYEPRDYAIGKFLLVGDRGAIADYDNEDANSIRLGYVVVDDVYRGMTLRGAPVPHSGLDSLYLDGIDAFVRERNMMLTMKIRGLMDLLVGAVEEHSPYHYSPFDAISDFLAIRIVDRVHYLPAPHQLGRLVRLATTISARD
jgi:hypothetical protein